MDNDTKQKVKARLEYLANEMRATAKKVENEGNPKKEKERVIKKQRSYGVTILSLIITPFYVRNRVDIGF
ncbi:hypothetical protein AKJ51_04875 [candidate division MSBL1 archaeon SCGC-AAA382A20]|uniref:Uncharacterized protein n=1 Tax=candidate division MSBL1 archaeon SCGC-AAA382A20 TaxID=1698280 RepID=A0A133VGX0_9EURY|nr:hypothetical protein AKJ51_04875 [candidate division MSBL1 archaeon SCGC-AAA382A20]